MSRVTEAHVEARRQQIVDAAWACFARKGYHETTMQDIADEAGLSAGAIYRYFSGKEAVLKAINDRSQEMGREVVAAARARADEPLGALEVIGQTMLPFFNDPMFETISRVNVEIWSEVIRSEELKEGFRKELTFWRAAVGRLLREAQERGQLKPDLDPDALTTVLMCTWEGMRHYRTVDKGFGPEAIVELFRSLLSEQASTRRLFEDLAVATAPLGIPHSMPAGQTPSVWTSAQAPRKRAKE